MLDGRAIHWRRWGEGAAEILYLHCALANAATLAALAAAMGRPAVGPDLPGHGKSAPYDRSADYQEQCLAVAVSAAADGPMDIVGHSFGATVGLRLALERPDLVRRLILIEPPFLAAAAGTDAYADYTKAAAPVYAALDAGDRSLAAQRFNALWGGVPWDRMPPGQRQMFADLIDVIPAQNAAVVEDNAAQLAPGRLEGCRVPILLMAGAHSLPVIGAVLDVLAARLPDTIRVTLADAGHMLPMTHASAAADAIDAFFSRG